jgi:hypothetical protein
MKPLKQLEAAMKNRNRGIAIALLSLLPAIGCGGEQCDPDQELNNHMCKAASTGGTGASADSGGSAGDSGGASAGTSLGALCASDSECTGDTNYCATPPTTPRFCTRTGCKEDPSVCPAGWTCMDLSIFLATLPAICEPPS